MMAQINVSEEGLEALKKALAQYGEEYKNNLKRLSNVIEEITNGDIQGEPATQLRNKFEDKKENFAQMAKTIDEAEEYMGMQHTKFNDTLSSFSSNMR